MSMFFKPYTCTLAAVSALLLMLACAKSKTEIELPLHQKTKQWRQEFRYFLDGADTLHLERFMQNRNFVPGESSAEISGERIISEFTGNRRNFKITLELSAQWAEDLNQGKEDELRLIFRYRNHEQTARYALVSGRIDTLRHPSQDFMIGGQNRSNVFVDTANQHTLLIANTVGVIGFITPQNDTILGFNP